MPTLTVDETTFATDASASFAGLFTAGAFGNDGFKDADNNDIEDADAISYKLGISAPGAASGLTDTLTNEAVTLSVNAAGTVVTGASATGGTVFTITLNADTGVVTLDQVRAVVHDDPLDPDESTLAGAAQRRQPGHADGDHHRRRPRHRHRDARHRRRLQVRGRRAVDRSVAGGGADADGGRDHLCDRRLGIVRRPVHVGAFGNDGFKDADNNDIEDADAISYALGISAPGAASGLIDTLTNEAVTLSVNAAGTVVTGSSATGGTVFTITLNADTGAVTLDQVRAVVHDDPPDPDESALAGAAQRRQPGHADGDDHRRRRRHRHRDARHRRRLQVRGRRAVDRSVAGGGADADGGRDHLCDRRLGLVRGPVHVWRLRQ